MDDLSPLDPQDYAAAVAREMLRARGYRDPRNVPPEVRDDVFGVMAVDPLYAQGFTQGLDPVELGHALQNRVWDGIGPHRRN